MSTKTKFFKQCDIRSRNDGIWTKNNESPLESISLTHFQSKGCTNLCESIPVQNKTSVETKIFEKYHFGGRTNRIWLKNDGPPRESSSLTHLYSKSCTNLYKSEFWHKVKWAPKQKFLKKILFQSPKRWNLVEKC